MKAYLAILAAFLAAPALASAQVPRPVDLLIPSGGGSASTGSFTLPLTGAVGNQSTTFVAVLAIQPDTSSAATAATYRFTVNGDTKTVPNFGDTPVAIGGSPPVATIEFDEAVVNGLSIIKITHLPPISTTTPQSWNFTILTAGAVPATCFSGKIHHVEATARQPRVSLITPGTPAVFRSDNHLFVPPTPALSTASVAFGVVNVGATRNLNLLIFNSGTEPLDPSSITLAAPFTLSIDPAPIAPNAAATATIPYTPTSAGAHATTLTVADATAAPASVAVPITGTGTFRDLVLCIDASNSMNWRNDGSSIVDCATLTGGGGLGSTYESESRMRQLRAAVNGFHAKMQAYGDRQARIGLVQFPGEDLACTASHADAVASATSTWTKSPSSWGLELYDLANLTSWNNKFTEATERGWWHSTPMRTGLTVSAGLLSGSGTHKGIILLGDGAHNVPSALGLSDWDAEAAALDTDGIRVYTIGFGTSGAVDHDALSHLSSGTAAADPLTGFSGHYVYNPSDDPLLLKKYYESILIDILGLQGTEDPIETIGPGQSKSHAAPVTDRDHRVTFSISWKTPARGLLSLTLRAPDGTRVDPSSPGVRFYADERQAMYTVDKPALNRRTSFAGAWTLDVAHDQKQLPAETYSWDVITRSDLEMKIRFGQSRYFTGDRLFVTAALADRGFGMRGRTVMLDIQRPGEGFGDWMAGTPVTLEALESAVGAHFAHMTEEATGVLKKVHYITQVLKKPIPPIVSAGTGIPMKDDGKNGDLRAGDGIYTASLDGLLTIPGSYRFRFVATGKTDDGQTFRREREAQHWVEVRPDVAQTPVQISSLEPGKEGFERVRAFVEPRDRLGNRMGPGYAKDVVIESSRARALSAGVIEDLNGGYYRDFEYDGRGGAPVVEVSVKGEKLPSRLGPAGSSGSSATTIWLLLVLLLLLAIALILALLRCCRAKST